MNRQEGSSSIYPIHPPGTKVLVRTSPDITVADRLIVAGSSLAIVGSVFWVPIVSRWAYRKWKAATDKKKKAVYGSVLVFIGLLSIGGPHRNPSFGKWINFRKWKFLNAWIKFIAMEVLADQPGPQINVKEDQAIFAFVPHGVFPFAFAFGVLPDLATQVFGTMRPVVATATKLFPVVRDVLTWIASVDASRSSVERALSNGDRIGVIPGGIAEIFEGYPKPNTHPDDEYAIVRSGFLRLAIKHNVPVIPVYCFGATKMLRRLQLPGLETISNYLRISICIFYGVLGLPIPFRQKLSYVMGSPIMPPPAVTGNDPNDAVERMRQDFCTELLRVFNRHKEAYGWSHKTLKLLNR